MQNDFKMPSHKPTASTLTSQSFSGFFWLLMGSVIQVFLKIGVLAVLARLVSPREFGVMGIALVVLEFSKLFANMGVGPAIIQRKELEQRHLTTGFTLSLGMGALFALLLLTTAPFFASFFRMGDLTKVLRIVSLIFLIDTFSLMGLALLQRNMKFRTIAIIEVVSYALGYGLFGIILAWQGWGVWALVTASMAQALLFTILLVFIQPFPKRFGFERNAFRELLFFGGGMTLAKFGNYLATQGDNLIVGRTLGASMLGVYGRAYQFMVMPASLFGNALDRVLFPAMAKVQDDKTRLAKAFLAGTNFLAMAALPISFIVIFSAKEIVLVLLGPNWIDVILPLQILACGLLFRMSYKMSDSLARAAGAVYRRAWRQLFYAAMVLIGSYIGQFWGLPGVAIGVAAALVLNFFMMAHLSVQITNISWLDVAKAHKQGAVLGLVTAVASYVIVALCRSSQVPYLFTLLLVAVGFLTIILIGTLYFPKLIINEEIKELVDKVLTSRIKRLSPKNV
jgi:PST family polysaccharide transporter